VKLNEEETRNMQAQGYRCPKCGNFIGKGYCGYHDEFYNTGHANNCPMVDERDKHDRCGQ
jgi:hypothetical protein